MMLVALAAGVLVTPLASTAQDEDSAQCEEVCSDAEERCFENCVSAADIDACQATCEEDADVCFDTCG